MSWAYSMAQDAWAPPIWLVDPGWSTSADGNLPAIPWSLSLESAASPWNTSSVIAYASARLCLVDPSKCWCIVCWEWSAWGRCFCYLSFNCYNEHRYLNCLVIVSCVFESSYRLLENLYFAYTNYLESFTGWDRYHCYFERGLSCYCLQTCCKSCNLRCIGKCWGLRGCRRLSPIFVFIATKGLHLGGFGSRRWGLGWCQANGVDHRSHEEGPKLFGFFRPQFFISQTPWQDVLWLDLPGF